ncbi:MAG TPA: hypothetical protein VG777_02500, partial [Thermoanaerobaculia bacterium]|nr:hypothetical protein [Thermoanaerobaculia bacterium]
RRLTGAAAIVAAASAAGWAWVRIAPESAWSAFLEARVVDARVASARGAILEAIARELAIGAAFGAVLLLAAAGFRDRPRRLSAAIVALLIIDLVPRTWNSVPLAPSARFDLAPDAVRAVASQGGRLFFDGETEIAEDPLLPMTPAIWGVPFAGNNDIDRFSPRRSFLFGRSLASLPFSDPRKVELLRLADVRAVSSVDPSAASVLAPWFPTSPRRTVYRLTGGARFRFAGSADPALGEEDARVRLLAPGRDPLSSPPIVEGAAPAAGAPIAGSAKIRVIARRADREEVALESPAPGWLFRSETFDPHWRARIDGRPAAVVAADFAFQAVAIPPGSHRVVFSYSDPAMAAAMVVSLAALLACAIALRPSNARR